MVHQSVLNERIQKLEESLGFFQHDFEALSKCVFELTNQLELIEKKLTIIEEKLTSEDYEN